MGKQAKMKQQNKKSKSLKKEQQKLKFEEEKQSKEELVSFVANLMKSNPEVSLKTMTRIPKYEEVCKYMEKQSNNAFRIDKMCAFCKTTDKKIKYCVKCNCIGYCCKECQIKDWDRHKLICGEMTTDRKKMKTIHKDSDYINMKILTALQIHNSLSVKNELPQKSIVEAYKYFNLEEVDDKGYTLLMSNNMNDMIWAKDRPDDWIKFHRERENAKFIGIYGFVYGLDTINDYKK
tara:strand:+ start:50 stop:751 length:702 start_codon:yes stop_codon:yes gene_type:complete